MKEAPGSSETSVLTRATRRNNPEDTILHNHVYKGLPQVGDNIDTINKNTETVIDASKEVGLEVNVEITKYMLVLRDQNAGQIRVIKIGNRSCEHVSQFKYLGMRVTNQNLIQEEIKRRLNSGNACYHSVQNLFPSRLLSKNVKVRIYNTIILAVVLYGCETCSLTVREEHKLRVFENRVLRGICGPKRYGVTGGWRKLHNEELHNCTHRQI
jgi:hypothetical protein